MPPVLPKSQCSECPFGPKSMKGWLGGYGSGVAAPLGVGAISGELWNARYFFCHPRADYEREDWEAVLLDRGELCVGFLHARAVWQVDAKFAHLSRSLRKYPRVKARGPFDGEMERHVQAMEDAVEKLIASKKMTVVVFPSFTEFHDHHCYRMKEDGWKTETYAVDDLEVTLPSTKKATKK